MMKFSLFLSVRMLAVLFCVFTWNCDVVAFRIIPHNRLHLYHNVKVQSLSLKLNGGGVETSKTQFKSTTTKSLDKKPTVKKNWKFIMQAFINTLIDPTLSSQAPRNGGHVETSDTLYVAMGDSTFGGGTCGPGGCG
mmetsp:Transcript_2511/g.4557  ORF Transcript_2511/g.4557 Transcript_2511/m.4557 type:complete len:136 (-) Transcript_2511:51-458(-)